MDPSYLGVPSPKALRARTPPPLRVLESTGSGASYAALRSSARPTCNYKRHKAPNAPILERIQRRPKLLLGVIAVLLAAWLVWHLSADYVVLFRFKMRDRAYEERWVKGCGLRKKPLIFVRGTNEVAVVWESNCDREFELRWGLEEVASEAGWMSSRRIKVDKWEQSKVKRVRIPDTSNTHYAYQSILKNLAPGAIYAYEVSLPSLVDITLDIKPQDTPPTPLASHSFSWAGLSSSSSSSSAPITLHFPILADNQNNVRTFHRILLSLLAYGRSQSPSLPKPHLILHAGDQVQNPHNLAQWQTDFWEALTSLLPVPLGQSTPILLARGNHDWDSTGENAYTGGSPPRADWLAHRGRRSRDKHVGTYMSYSPHARCRILVLDSNLDEMEQREQEEWLEWELGRTEWTSASLRIVMVHVAPFLEYWDTKAWTEGKESQWSIFVRLRLTPLLSQHGASLVISGHQHAYSRGFLPHSLHRAYTTSNSSSTLPPFALATVHERGWEKSSPILNTIDEDGTVYVVCGGAGGTLDEDRVEQWGFYERSIRGKYHFGWMGLGFAGGAGETGRVEMKERAKRVYEVQARESCRPGFGVTDVLEWRAVGVDGRVLDAFRIEAMGCSDKG